MQRPNLLSIALTGIFGLAVGAPAQDNTGNGNRHQAEMAEMTDRIRTLESKVTNMEEALQNYKQSNANRFNELNETIRSLREELARSSSGREVAALKDANESLRRSIEKVDENRVADSKKVQATLKDIAEALSKKAQPVHTAPDSSHVPPETHRDPSPAPAPSPASDQKGFEYAVQARDTLSGIVAKARASGILVTQKQVMEANPTVNWKSLRIGQKIFVPSPAAK